MCVMVLLQVMEENIHWALVQAHPALGAIEVHINR
jgi:hypothetical protein